jgi:DNA-binding CsgD family transcriptional regulator
MVTSRIWFTGEEKAELWERWKNGQSAAAISPALERRNKTGVQRIVAVHGGIAPAPRRRAVAALRLEEREEISRGIAAGRSVRRIARGLRRSPSTISREIRRNGGSQVYRANRADRRAWDWALRPNTTLADLLTLLFTLIHMRQDYLRPRVPSWAFPLVHLPLQVPCSLGAAASSQVVHANRGERAMSKGLPRNRSFGSAER